MATIELTADNFESVVKRDGITLVDYWASWCGPCQMFAPVFDAASEAHPDITFGKVDTDAQQLLAFAAQIEAIPTVIAFRDGIAVSSQAGGLPAEALEGLIQGIRHMDMDDVRRQIADQRRTRSA